MYLFSEKLHPSIRCTIHKPELENKHFFFNSGDQKHSKPELHTKEIWWRCSWTGVPHCRTASSEVTSLFTSLVKSFVRYFTPVRKILHYISFVTLARPAHLLPAAIQERISGITWEKWNTAEEKNGKERKAKTGFHPSFCHRIDFRNFQFHYYAFGQT